MGNGLMDQVQPERKACPISNPDLATSMSRFLRIDPYGNYYQTSASRRSARANRTGIEQKFFQVEPPKS
jgi:hypothetical protein